MGFWDTVKDYGETALNVKRSAGTAPSRHRHRAEGHAPGSGSGLLRRRPAGRALPRAAQRQDREASGEAARYQWIPISPAGSSDVNGGFGEMGSRYDAMYRGEGPSLGREMLQQGSRRHNNRPPELHHRRRG